MVLPKVEKKNVVFVISWKKWRMSDFLFFLFILRKNQQNKATRQQRRGQILYTEQVNLHGGQLASQHLTELTRQRAR